MRTLKNITWFFFADIVFKIVKLMFIETYISMNAYLDAWRNLSRYKVKMPYHTYNKFFYIIFIIIMTIGCKKEEKPFNVYMPILIDNTDIPIISMYYEPYGLPAVEMGPKIIICVWPNGEVVCSKDTVLGGPPYFKGQIDLGKINKFFLDMNKIGIFTDTIRYYSYVGADASCQVISMYYKSNRMNMTSWHKFFEDDPDALPTNDGILFLEGQDREKIIAEQPEEFKRFLKSWDIICVSFKELIPKDVQQVDNLHFKLTKLSSK